MIRRQRKAVNIGDVGYVTLSMDSILEISLKNFEKWVKESADRDIVHSFSEIVRAIAVSIVTTPRKLGPEHAEFDDTLTMWSSKFLDVAPSECLTDSHGAKKKLSVPRALLSVTKLIKKLSHDGSLSSLDEVAIFSFNETNGADVKEPTCHASSRPEVSSFEPESAFDDVYNMLRCDNLDTRRARASAVGLVLTPGTAPDIQKIAVEICKFSTARTLFRDLTLPEFTARQFKKDQPILPQPGTAEWQEEVPTEARGSSEPAAMPAEAVDDPSTEDINEADAEVITLTPQQIDQ